MGIYSNVPKYIEIQHERFKERVIKYYKDKEVAEYLYETVLDGTCI